MKNIYRAGLLALGILIFSQQQASAWINSKFGVGLNWSWSSGGNSLLWGAARGGQPPGHDHFPGYFPAEHGHHHHAMMPAPQMAPVAMPAAAPAPASNTAAYYYQPTYQTVTFPGYYQTPSYYYPANFYYYGR